MGNDLVRLGDAHTALAECRTLSDFKKLKDLAEAARSFAKANELGSEVEHFAQEIVRRAERGMGECLRDSEKAPKGTAALKSQAGTLDTPPTLADLSITKNESSRAQKVAAVPEDVFEEYIATAKTPSRAKLLRLAYKANPPKPIALPEGTFDLILADPPWDNMNTVESRDVVNHYPTMTLKEIEEMSLPKTAKDSVLFLWATAPCLPEALDVMQAWGYEYRTHAVWDKVAIGLGFWFRGQHELLLVGVKGKYKTPDESARVSSVFREKRTKHSRKPECVYEALEKMFPNATRVELFARQAREGWTSWGNEV